MRTSDEGQVGLEKGFQRETEKNKTKTQQALGGRRGSAGERKGREQTTVHRQALEAWTAPWQGQKQSKINGEAKEISVCGHCQQFS